MMAKTVLTSAVLFIYFLRISRVFSSPPSPPNTDILDEAIDSPDATFLATFAAAARSASASASTSANTPSVSFSSSPSSSDYTAPGYEIHFPESSPRAHVVFYPLKPLNVSSLFLSLEVKMSRQTNYPFFVSYAVKEQANEWALALPGNALHRAYTLLMGHDVAGRNGVTPFPLNEWVKIVWGWDGRSGWTGMTVNRTLIFSGSNAIFKKRLRPDGKLVFGQEIDDFDELKFDENQRFIGSIRNVSLWSYSFFDSKSHNSLRGAIVDSIPLIELKDGATSNGTTVQCSTPTKGVAFKGNHSFIGLSYSVRVCRNTCESESQSSAAKGWTLFGNGTCACFSTLVDAIPASNDTQSGMFCSCRISDLESQLESVYPNIESLLPDQRPIEGGIVHIHDFVYANCKSGVSPRNGNNFSEFECRIAPRNAIGPNWRLRESTKCEKRCPPNKTIRIPRYCSSELTCSDENRLPGTVCKSQPKYGIYSEGGALCTENGEWRNDLRCEEITCPNPFDHQALSSYSHCAYIGFCTKRLAVGSSCPAHAKRGYTDVNGEIYCELGMDPGSTTGRWIQRGLTCRRIQCGFKPHFEDCSNWRCTDYDNLNSSCTAKPPFLSNYYWGGYARGNITCLEDGEWHGTVRCRKGVSKNFAYLAVGLTILLAIIIVSCAFGWRHYVQFKNRRTRQQRGGDRARGASGQRNRNRRSVSANWDHVSMPNIDQSHVNGIQAISGNVVPMSCPPSYEQSVYGPPPPSYDSVFFPKPEDGETSSPAISSADPFRNGQNVDHTSFISSMPPAYSEEVSDAPIQTISLAIPVSNGQSTPSGSFSRPDLPAYIEEVSNISSQSTSSGFPNTNGQSTPSPSLPPPPAYSEEVSFLPSHSISLASPDTNEYSSSSPLFTMPPAYLEELSDSSSQTSSATADTNDILPNEVSSPLTASAGQEGLNQ